MPRREWIKKNIRAINRSGFTSFCLLVIHNSLMCDRIAVQPKLHKATVNTKYGDLHLPNENKSF